MAAGRALGYYIAATNIVTQGANRTADPCSSRLRVVRHRGVGYGLCHRTSSSSCSEGRWRTEMKTPPTRRALSSSRLAAVSTAGAVFRHCLHRPGASWCAYGRRGLHSLDTVLPLYHGALRRASNGLRASLLPGKRPCYAQIRNSSIEAQRTPYDAKSVILDFGFGRVCVTRRIYSGVGSTARQSILRKGGQGRRRAGAIRVAHGRVPA